MTKAQAKALTTAAGHLSANNTAAFLKAVAHLIRSASNQKQIDAIKVAAFDIQFGGK